jgi:hypothetical protein
MTKRMKDQTVGLIFISVKTMSWSESPGNVSTFLKLSGWFVTTRSMVLDPLVGYFTSCAIPLSSNMSANFS